MEQWPTMSELSPEDVCANLEHVVDSLTGWLAYNDDEDPGVQRAARLDFAAAQHDLHRLVEQSRFKVVLQIGDSPARAIAYSLGQTQAMERIEQELGPGSRLLFNYALDLPVNNPEQAIRDELFVGEAGRLISCSQLAEALANGSQLELATIEDF